MSLSLITNAQTYGDKTAIIAQEGVFSYRDLLDASHQVATLLLQGEKDLNCQRVAYVVPSGFTHVAVQWGIWRSGGIAVPLCPSHPLPEWEYVIDNAQVSILVSSPPFESPCRDLASRKGLRFLSTTEISQVITPSPLPLLDDNRGALILYTSGTTGKPKGVLHTFKSLLAQVNSLVTAWEWTSSDRILHVLPLHHIHGIVNALTCALYSGATCHLLPKFEAETVWHLIAQKNYTLFMAVPTIYVKLINYWQQADASTRGRLSDGCKSMRLMVSGSAPLPVSVLQKWQEISGHFLLERYGMTEIGMALSNPLHGKRLAGYVGTALPGVEVRLVDENGVVIQEDNVAGEIQVRGDTVFSQYWANPEATRQAFQDGWFRTGDLAVRENGNYRILGRISTDIIKTGGYKVSALEIEEVLRTHPSIVDCAVVAVPDAEWGERVCVAIITEDKQLTLEKLRVWAKERLAVYKIPTRMVVVSHFPRNPMGKVIKPALRQLFDPHATTSQTG
ncbi:MAG: acyl-CoA synthetase [Geminocystis sp.]|nr:acyl-CoA synthetase [Geminocystis sp.]MCS7148301.1 acyl-CoA synthetase [Geminocystis sp.]MCX8077716.1 acyl-CoA synthetase [Geminocystis sp.]MDW8116608.1 acyl-CoA synthetase [Geminocystis sp.]HIK37344.1 acyl-CoA synthetase [Geminocystis sp. M7585_C2015_104]